MALFASNMFKGASHYYAQLYNQEAFEGNPFIMLSKALEKPSHDGQKIIQKIMDNGEDLMKTINQYLDMEEHTMDNIIEIVLRLPLVDGKRWIPCVSHYGSLYSICSNLPTDELVSGLEYIASLTDRPPTSTDAWNIMTQHFFWNFGSSECHSPELVEALNILLKNGCSFNIPLLYGRYQDMSNENLKGLTIIPTGELGWFNPVMHLLWIDEALGMKYLVQSLARHGADPNEKIFSHITFLQQNQAMTRSILGHVLVIFAQDRYFGKEYAKKIATILIAFEADTTEFFYRDPEAVGGDQLDEEKQRIIIEAREKIEEAKKKLWLLQLSHSELDSDVRKLIGEMLCNLIL